MKGTNIIYPRKRSCHGYEQHGEVQKVLTFYYRYLNIDCVSLILLMINKNTDTKSTNILLLIT